LNDPFNGLVCPSSAFLDAIAVGYGTAVARRRRMRIDKRLAAGVLAVLALVLVLALRPSKRNVDTARAAPEEASDRAAWAPPEVPARSFERPTPERLPIDNLRIDEVTVDHDEVCKGDEITVTVKARSLDGEDAFLSYGVKGKPRLFGPRFSLRLDEPIGERRMNVFVRGKMGGAVEASVPPVRIKDCPAKARATIEERREGTMLDRIWLTAGVSSADGDPFQAVAYEWDFGDGTVQKTRDATVEHSYEARIHKDLESYFFVKLKAVDAAGRTVAATRSVRFVNFGFIPLRRRHVRLFSGFRPAPTAAAPDAEERWLYHGAPYTVAITRVTVKDVPDGPEGRGKPAVTSHEYGAAELLGVTEVPPGKSVAIKDLGHLRPPLGIRRVVEITGAPRGAQTADGSFSLVPPPSAVALQTEGEAATSALVLQGEGDVQPQSEE
jgi:hypothetical protein